MNMGLNIVMELEKEQVAEIDEEIAKSLSDYETLKLYKNDNGDYKLFYENTSDIGVELDVDKEKVEAFLEKERDDIER